MQRIDLYKFDQIKPVVLFRNPFDEIASTYIKYDRRPDENKRENIDKELLIFRIEKYKKYINFWARYSRDKKNKGNFLTVDYDDLVSNSNTALKKILIFYNYEVIEEYLQTSALIHTKENTNKNIYGPKIYNRTRFSDTEKKDNQKKLIETTFEEILSKTNINEDYKYLKSIS